MQAILTATVDAIYSTPKYNCLSQTWEKSDVGGQEKKEKRLVLVLYFWDSKSVPECTGGRGVRM